MSQDICYVNSETGWSRERVEDLFPESKADGSVKWQHLREDSMDETIDIAGTIGFRKVITQVYQDQGRNIGKRQGQRLVNKVKELDWVRWTGYAESADKLLPVTNVSSLSSWTRGYINSADKSRLANTKKRKNPIDD